MPMVVDTSVTMAWCFEDEANDAADAVLVLLREADTVVPMLWQLEVVNVLLVAERLAAPLAILEDRLATACRTAGVRLLIDS